MKGGPEMKTIPDREYEAADITQAVVANFICSCGVVPQQTDNFCPLCGEQNEHFDLAALNKERNTAYRHRRQVSKACTARKHPAIRKSFKRTEAFDPVKQGLFCPDCGMKLL